MNSLFSKAVGSLIILFAVAGGAVAQTTISHGVRPTQLFAGESLVYDGKVKKFLQGLTIAELTMATTAVPGSNDLVVKSEAVSKGTLLKLFRYSFVQRYESTVDSTSFRIIKTSKHDVQKQRIRNSEAIFNYGEKRVTFVETDPVDPNRPPRMIASEIGDQMYDMITAIYAVRLVPLTVGQRLEFPVSDSGLVYNVPIVIAGRERIKTALGRVWCFRVEPEIFGEGRLIEQKGSMAVWITDDQRRIPVRAEVDSGIGKIEIKLKSATQTK